MSTNLRDAFLCNVEHQMTVRGMSRKQLADKMGVTPSFVSQMFKKRWTPGLDVIEKVAKALGVSAVSLLVEPAENAA